MVKRSSRRFTSQAFRLSISANARSGHEANQEPNISRNSDVAGFFINVMRVLQKASERGRRTLGKLWGLCLKPSNIVCTVATPVHIYA